jgi:protein HIRA/HIR1
LAVFHFDSEELEGIAPHSVQEQYLQKFGFVPPPLPEGFSHHVPARASNTAASRITPPPSPSRAVGPSPAQQSSQSGFGGVNGGGGEVINKLVAKRSNKKRIQPNFVGSVPSAASSSALNHSGATAGLSNGMMLSRHFDPPRIQPPPLPHPISQPPSHSISPLADNWPHAYDADVDMSAPTDMDVPIDSLSTGNNLKGKRKASMYDGVEDSRVKPRTLGGDRPRESVVVREIGGGITSSPAIWGDAYMAGALPVPPLYNSLSVRVEGSEDVLEGRNFESDGTSLSFYSWILCYVANYFSYRPN